MDANIISVGIPGTCRTQKVIVFFFVFFVHQAGRVFIVESCKELKDVQICTVNGNNQSSNERKETKKCDLGHPSVLQRGLTTGKIGQKKFFVVQPW